VRDLKLAVQQLYGDSQVAPNVAVLLFEQLNEKFR
jgi:hypothetical protein